jgi:hypothetical protein
MYNNMTRIFSLDSEAFKVQSSKDSRWSNIPQLESPCLSNEDCYASSLNGSKNSAQSVDHRIKEAIKSVTEDTEVLKSETFNTLLSETHSTLVEMVKENHPPEIKQSLHSLISLLQENTDLLNLFQGYANWLLKA